MSVEVIERGTQTVRCECGALLRYGHKDIHKEPPPRGKLATHMGCVVGGWPWVDCPCCERAVLVGGDF